MPGFAMTTNDANDHWSQLHKLVFRFIFVYCVLYLPVLVVNAIPGIDENSDFYVKLWDGTVVWVGDHVLHLSEPITVRPNGSGDTTWNYVQVFCFAIAAAAVTIIWTVVDFRRLHYR